MEGVIDWLRDILGWVLAAVGSWVTYVTIRLHKQSERLAMLEQTVTQIAASLPAKFLELHKAIDDMREESRAGRKELFDRIEDTRLELKDDINRESDKRDRRTR
jgi:hypothetical protein